MVFVLLGTPRDPRALVDAAGWNVGVFACIVLHEFAHSLVARQRGYAVRDIVRLPICALLLTTCP
jgi:Zn-dependent protease